MPKHNIFYVINQGTKNFKALTANYSKCRHQWKRSFQVHASQATKMTTELPELIFQLSRELLVI